MTSTPAPAADRNALRLPVLDGRVAIGIALVLTAAVLVTVRTSPPLFGTSAALALAFAAYSAVRWPLPSLVVGVLSVLADSEITPMLLPGIDMGPIGISEPLLAVISLALLARSARMGTLVPALRDPVLPLVLLFVGLGVVSALVNATPPTVVLLGLFMTLDAVAIYFVTRTIAIDGRGAATAVGAVVAVAVAMAIFGIAQVVVAPTLIGFSLMQGQFGEGGRITSFMGNPNMVAAVIGMTVPFTLYGSRHLERRGWRWAARIGLFLLLVALLLTFSRGGWLAVGGGLLLGALLVDWKSALVFAAGLVLAWGTVTVMPHNLAISAPVAGGGGGGSESGGGGPSIIDSTVDRIENLSDRNDTRGQFLRDGARIVADNLLLGVGPGRYGGAAAVIIKSPVYEEYGATLFGYRTVHNFWLHIAGEGGALGLAVLLTVLIGLLVRFVRAARAATGGRFVLLAGAATLIIVTSLNSVTEMIFEGNMPAIPIWFLLGIASLAAPVLPLVRRAGRAAEPAEATA